MLSVSVTGSPSQNSARGYQQRIATHDKEFARSLFNGSPDEYDHMVEYSQAYTDIYNDNTLSVDEEEAAIASLNEEFGFDPEIGKDEFEDMMTATNLLTRLT